MKKNLFSQKIEYLFESLNIGEEEFVKLFWNGIKPSFLVRKKSVIGKWYEGDITQPKAFYFDTYPISKLHKDGKLFFTKSSFLDEPFDKFKKRVDNYISYITKPKNIFEYRYIYYYDIYLKKVSFVKIYTEEEIDNSRYKIRMTAPEIYSSEDIDTYYGELNIVNDYYHLSLKNSFEFITFYFMLNKGLKKNSAIYGLRLGLSYDKGLPNSGKNLLTKHILSKEEEMKFYLNANESDTIVSDESNQDIYSSDKDNYLKKIHKKINNLTIFMKKTREILNQSINRDVYISLFHNGLSSLNQISQKVYNNSTFYSSRRRSTREVFLSKLSLTPNSACAFVYPIFAKDSTLFADRDRRSIDSLEKIMKVAKNGLKIDMIIVVEHNYILDKYQKLSIERLIESGINIRFSLKKNIEKIVTSYDFLYSKSKEVAIYRNSGDRICYFKVTCNQDSINNLSYDFENIKKQSYSFEEFLEQKHIEISKELKHLVGEWFVYNYGTIQNSEGKTKIWELKYYINRLGRVDIIYKNKLKYKGYLKVSNDKKSYIVLNSLKSSNQSFIIIHNKDIYKKIFKVSMIYNQFLTEKDIITFGIFSKIRLNLNTIRDIFGESNKIILKEDEKFEEKIRNIYLKYEI